MLLEHLTNPQWWIGAIFILGFFALMWRFARKPKGKALDWDYCYAFVAEKSDAANPQLSKCFKDMLKALPKGKRGSVTLIRLAVMNRGALSITAADHLRPLTVAFPKTAHMLAPQFIEAFGPEPETPPTLIESCAASTPSVSPSRSTTSARASHRSSTCGTCRWPSSRNPWS